MAPHVIDYIYTHTTPHLYQVTNMSVVDEVAKLNLSEKLSTKLQGLKKEAAESTNEETQIKLELDILRLLLEEDKFHAVLSRSNESDLAAKSVELTKCVAYALYRLGNITDLRALAEGTEDVGVKLTLAQAEYRFGSMETALHLLEECKPYLSSDDALDLETNVYAVKALRGVRVHKPPRSFDDWFNMGCCYISRGKFEQSLDALKHALQYADQPEDEASTKAQMAVVYTFMNNLKEAQRLYSEIPKLNRSTELVIDHNKLAAGPEIDSLDDVHAALCVYDSLRDMKLELNISQRQVLERTALKLRAKAGLPSISKAKKFTNEFTLDLEPLCVAFFYHLSRKQLNRKMHSESATANEKLAAELVLKALDNPDGVNYKHEDFEWFSKTLKPHEACYKFGSLLYDLKLRLKNERDDKFFYRSLDSIGDDKVRIAGMCAIQQGPPAENIKNDVKRLVEGLDPQELISKVVNVDNTKTRKRRANRNKLPVNYDPKRKPSPERWIAKKDRSDAVSTGATQGLAEAKQKKSGGKVSGPKSTKKSRK